MWVVFRNLKYCSRRSKVLLFKVTYSEFFFFLSTFHLCAGGGYLAQGGLQMRCGLNNWMVHI